MNTFVGHKPNRQHVQALTDCKLGQEALLELFAKALEDTKVSLVKADSKLQINRLQGAAKVLQDFLDAVETSSEILARVDSSQ